MAGFDVATITESLNDVDRAILDGEAEGFARVHYDKKNGRILGGTLVARHAGEMISELTLATVGKRSGCFRPRSIPTPPRRKRCVRPATPICAQN